MRKQRFNGVHGSQNDDFYSGNEDLYYQPSETREQMQTAELIFQTEPNFDETVIVRGHPEEGYHTFQIWQKI